MDSFFKIWERITPGRGIRRYAIKKLGENGW